MLSSSTSLLLLLASTTVDINSVEAFSAINGNSNEAFQRALLAERLNGGTTTRVNGNTVANNGASTHNIAPSHEEVATVGTVSPDDPYSFVVPVLGDLRKFDFVWLYVGI